MALTSLLAVVYPVQADDHWWHMLTGRYLLDHGVVPRTDPFSFTYRGEPWVNWEWLGGLAMTSAFDGLGPAGLVVLRLAAVAATVVVLWRHLRRIEGAPRPAAPLLALMLLGLCVLVIFGRVGDRPHLYAVPFLAAAHHLSVQAAHRRDPRPIVVLLGLMTVWVVLHPSWLLGLLVATAVWIDQWRRDPRGHGTRGGAADRWCYRLAPLLLALPGLLLVGSSDYGSALARLLTSSDLREWQPLWAYLHWTNVPLLAFLVLTGGWLALLVAERRLLRELTVWLITAVLVASWWFVRFTPLFAVLAVPVLAERALRRWSSVELPRRTLNLALILAGLGLLLVTLLARSVYRRELAVEVDPRANPVAVADFMARHRLDGNVWCSELTSHAFLAFRGYPATRTYIDGRIPQLFPESFLREYRDGRASPQRFGALLDRDDLDHVVILEMFRPEVAPLVAVLHARREYVLLHVDDHHMLWSRIRPGGTSLPSPYQVLVPPLIDDRWFADALRPEYFPVALREVTQLLREQPASVVGRTLVAALLQHPAATDEQRVALRRLGASGAGGTGSRVP
ncbi:MAG: hypothetical protein JRI55_34030 [Deltaproteobacteria bacterium]|nr:hypothetical protein [Deltaproteobacteria bacterium]